MVQERYKRRVADQSSTIEAVKRRAALLEGQVTTLRAQLALSPQRRTNAASGNRSGNRSGIRSGNRNNGVAYTPVAMSRPSSRSPASGRRVVAARGSAVDNHYVVSSYTTAAPEESRAVSPRPSPRSTPSGARRNWHAHGVPRTPEEYAALSEEAREIDRELELEIARSAAAAEAEAEANVAAAHAHAHARAHGSSAGGSGNASAERRSAIMVRVDLFLFPPSPSSLVLLWPLIISFAHFCCSLNFRPSFLFVAQKVRLQETAMDLKGELALLVASGAFVRCSLLAVCAPASGVALAA